MLVRVEVWVHRRVSPTGCFDRGYHAPARSHLRAVIYFFLESPRKSLAIRIGGSHHLLARSILQVLEQMQKFLLATLVRSDTVFLSAVTETDHIIGNEIHASLGDSVCDHFVT